MGRGKRFWAGLCAALLLAQPAGAATYTVTNAADAGAGSFRAALTGAVAGDIINWTSGGTLTLASGLPTLVGGLQVNVSSAASAVTIAGSPNAVPLNGNVSFDNDNVAQALTISAPITGSGPFTKYGAGELDLLGANTFTGGLIMSSGTLVVNGDASFGDGSGAFTVNGISTVSFTGVVTSTRSWVLNAATYVKDNGNNSTLTGVVIGGGSLNKSGAGLMELGGSNGYSGGTTLNAGTLRADNGSALGSGPLTINGGAFQLNGASLTLSIPITLNTNSATVDTMGNYATLAGVISGAGGLSMTSSGTLVLSAVNTYLSSTTVSGGGTLVINADSGLGAAGTSLTLSNGSALRLGSVSNPFTTGRPIVLGAGGGAIDTNGAQAVFSGGITDGGSGGAFTKAGSGTLTLAAASAYTGSTTVNAGMLVAGANSALGSGALLVQSGATLDVGSFSQTVASYSGAGTLALKIPSPAATVVTVTGNANFTGNTLKVSLAPQRVTEAQVFTPIHYGSITSLPTVVSPALITFTPTAGANDLQLTAHLVPFASVVANGNQAAIGGALEPLRAQAGNDAETVIDALSTLDQGSLRAALDQIGPVSLGAVGGLGQAQASAQASAVQRRMNALARSWDSEGSSVQRYTVTGKSPYPGPLYAEAPGDDLPFDSRESGSPWGFFSSVLFGAGKVQEAAGPSGVQPGYSFNTGGFTAGGDYRFNPHLAAGLSAGYLHAHAGILDPGSGTMNGSSGRLGAYATAFGESFAANLYVGGAVDAFKTERGIVLPGLPARTATGTPHGHELNIHPSASYDVKTRDYGTFSPFGAFDYDELWLGAFQETGADSLDLSVNPQTQVTEQSALGLRYSQRLASDAHVFTPYGSLGWRHAFNDQSRPITSSLAGGAPFTVSTGRIARDGTLVGLGVAVNWTKDLEVKLDYTGDYRSHYQDSDVSLLGRFRF